MSSLPSVLEYALKAKETATKKFFFLYELLSEAGKEKVRNFLTTKNITAFVPTNEAIDMLLGNEELKIQGTTEGKDLAAKLTSSDMSTKKLAQDILLAVIAYHLVKGEFCRSDLIAVKKSYLPSFVKTFAEDTPVKIMQAISVVSWQEQSENGKMANHHIMLDHAEVVSKAVSCANGKVFFVDAVLVPPFVMKGVELKTIYEPKDATCSGMDSLYEGFVPHRQKKMKKEMM